MNTIEKTEILECVKDGRERVIIDPPLLCSVCGDPEPCSHDFDKENQELEAIARRMGTNNGL